MTSVIELEKGFATDIEGLQTKFQHKEFNTPYTGNIIVDFSQFTDDQSGKKSDDPNDPAAKDSPIVPATDGRYYHTIRDITWATYHAIFPNRPAQYFYTMTDEERQSCISPFINAGKQTTSDLINIMLSYIIWGGSLSLILSTYHTWYSETTLQADTMNDEHATFVKLIDVRRYVYSNCLSDSSKYGEGWDLGVLCFWKLFRNYL